MKVFCSILFGLLLVLISQAATAQTRPTTSQTLDFWITNTEKEVVSVADAMPEEKYSFAPTSGEFTGVRTFAEQMKHLSAANYQLAALILGENPPHGEHDETALDSIKSKAQIMVYVKGSFAALHRAVATISEGNMLEPVVHLRRLSAEEPASFRGRRGGPLVRSLRPDGGIPAHERHCSAC